MLMSLQHNGGISILSKQDKQIDMEKLGKKSPKRMKEISKQNKRKPNVWKEPLALKVNHLLSRDQQPTT